MRRGFESRERLKKGSHGKKKREEGEGWKEEGVRRR